MSELPSEYTHDNKTIYVENSAGEPFPILTLADNKYLTEQDRQVILERTTVALNHVINMGLSEMRQIGDESA